MSTHSSSRSVALLAASLVALAATRSGQSVYICGDRDLPLVMQQVPQSFEAYGYNNNAMATYNRYMDIFRYVSADGTYGINGVSEFAGFPSSDSLYATWGFRWGRDDVGMAMMRWSGPCSRIVESDVAFNPSVNWAFDPITAEDNPSRVHYLTVLMHELGHAVGLNTNGETYDYDQPSVMHAYYPGMVVPTYTLHVPEAYLIRRRYSGQTPVKSLKDMAVFSHWANNGLHNSFTDKAVYRPLERLTVNHLTIENTGTRDIANVHVRLYLSTDRNITTGDILLGDWSFDTFPHEVYGVYDFTATIPSSVARRRYHVGALMSSDGHGSDEIHDNDATHLYGTIDVQESCLADGYEPNGSPSAAARVGNGSAAGLRICSGDEDWFSISVAKGQALVMETRFSSGSGDLDLRLFDPQMNVIDRSDGTTDLESVGFSSAAASGLYYLQVYSDVVVENGYTLNVSLTGGTSPGGGGSSGGGCYVRPVSGPSGPREALAAAWWLLLVLVVVGVRAQRSAARVHEHRGA